MCKPCVDGIARGLRYPVRVPHSTKLPSVSHFNYQPCFRLFFFSFGVVFIHHGTVETYAEKIIDAEEAQMRNVAGEIHGAVFAMGKCLEKGISEINLYYDYVGIEKWCTGEWKANKRGTKALREYYELIKGQLTVHFHKVASHTGVMYNEMADQLAKNALLE